MAWFALARELGMSVARAQAEISSYEFSEWLAFWRMSHNPDDRRNAMVCTLLAKLGGVKNAKPEHYMPHIHKPAMTVKQMKAQLMRALPSANEPRLR